MSKIPRQYSIVTVVDNETKEEATGNILEYTRDRIVLRTEKSGNEKGRIKEIKTLIFDAKKVHFK